MNLDDTPKKPRPESVVPMINVVFLLLIFFLMTATIAPPEPFDVTLPASNAEAPSDGATALYVSASGDLAWAGHRGEDALAALRNDGIGQAGRGLLIIRADRTVPGVEIARLLKRLAALGITHSQLVAEARS